MISLAENLKALKAGERLVQYKPAKKIANGQAAHFEAGQGSLKDNLAAVKAGNPVKKATPKKKAPAVRKKRGQTSLRIDRELFAKELIKNSMNATKAYQAVSPKVTAKTAATEGFRLLREPETIEILQPMLEQLFTEAGIDAQWVFKRLVEMSQATPLDYFTINNAGQPVLDMSDLTPAQRANLKEIKITDTKFGQNITVKVCDAQKAIDSIGRHLGLFIDRLPEKDVERIGDMLERAVKRIKATKDLDAWKDIILDVEVAEVR